MLKSQMKTATVPLLTLAIATGIGTLAHRLPAQRQQPAEPPARIAEANPTNAESTKPKQPRLDLHGDPLPEGALARLGTVRMRHGHPISGAVFSSDGKSILASDLYSGVHVWDVAEGKEVRRFFTKDYCHRLALSPDGKTLAVALDDLTVRLCDPSSGREFGSLARDSDRIGQLVFSNDSSLLATGTGDKSVHIWDVATRKLVHKVTFAEGVGKVAFSSDSKLLACGTWDGYCRLWDLAQGKEVRQLRDELKTQRSLNAIFAPNGGPLAVWGYEDASIRLFDANGVKEIWRFKKEGETKSTSPWGWSTNIFVSFSPNGKILATFRERGRIDLWDVESGKKLHTLACDGGHFPTFLVFSPDGSKLASAGGDPWSGDNIVRLWDVAQGKEILHAGHGSPISSVAISPDGNTVATAGQDGVIHLWERSSGKHLFRFEGHPGRWPHVSFSSDGQRVIWCGNWNDDRILRIWDPRTGEVVSRLKLQGPNEFWKGVADDGKTAFSVDLKGTSARFHDLTTGKVIREIADGAYHQPLALSPAGDKMVCSDGTLRNAADGKEVLKIGRVYGSNPSVKFSADGRRLIAAVTAKGPHGDFDPRCDPPAEEIAVVDAIEGKELRRFGKRVEKYYAIDAAARIERRQNGYYRWRLRGQAGRTDHHALGDGNRQRTRPLSRASRTNAKLSHFRGRPLGRVRRR